MARADPARPATLAEAGQRYGFGVEIVAKVEDGAGVVSSSAIRKALEQGDLAAAARGLGRNYAVSGQVISGQRLGRKLGVPTANIALEPTNRLAHGIYAVVARVEGCAYPAVASFGTRPTVDDGPPLLEVHLLDFDGDLYGREMEVEFIARIRDELKFEFPSPAGRRNGARQGARPRHPGVLCSWMEAKRTVIASILANCRNSERGTKRGHKALKNLGPAGKMAARPARRQDALLRRPLKPAGPKRQRRNTWTER